MELETSNREVISVASHMDWFVAATAKVLQDMQAKIQASELFNVSG